VGAGRRHRERGEVVTGERCERARRLERDRPPCGLHHRGLGRRDDERAHERLVAERVGHDADLRLLARLRDRERAERAQQRLVDVFPRERERKEIRLRVGLRLDTRQREEPAAIGRLPLGVIGDLDAPYRLRLRRVPAAAGDERGERVVLELAAHFVGHAEPPRHHALTKEARPAVEQHEHAQLLREHLLLAP
jgi:hypothetical protein